MTSLLVDCIGCLVTNDEHLGAGLLGRIDDAALVVDDGRVAWAGSRRRRPTGAERYLDAGGRTVIPGFVDSHGHLVFAGDRSEEFAARMAGAPYQAGGIRSTVRSTRAASDQVLGVRARGLVAEALRSGTTTVECKSGYGLTVVDERRCLQVAGTVTDEVTFLGAHVVPPEFADRPDDYVTLVCTTMLDACAPTPGGSTSFATGVPSTPTRRTRSYWRAGVAASPPRPRQPIGGGSRRPAGRRAGCGVG